jgi:preprotein translocase subunit YajC
MNTFFKVKETIQVNEVRMESLAEGMLILREEQKQQQQQQQNGQQLQEGVEQMKPEHLWGHLIKVDIDTISIPYNYVKEN